MVRWARAKRLEAEFITGELNPPITDTNPFEGLDLLQPTVRDPGLPAAIGFESAQRLVSTFQRYETSIALRLFRTLHELERLQRMREGEHLPAPAAVDISVHAQTGTVDSVLAAAVEQPKSMSGGVDIDLHTDARTDSVREALEQPKAIPGDEE
jgi:hypothetical protein